MHVHVTQRSMTELLFSGFFALALRTRPVDPGKVR
jgi:hypothetical protein